MPDLEARKEALKSKLDSLHQSHVFRWWPELNREQKAELLAEIEGLDLRAFNARLKLLAAGGLGEKFSGDMAPPDYIRLPRTDEEQARFAAARRRGEQMIAQGRVGVVMVAGGQGSRLGYHHPKGMFPVGPVTDRSLFQLHAEKIMARGRRGGAVIPWCIMTSEATHDETVEFFHARDFFGMGEDNVRFFMQRMIPAVDRRHRLILSSKSSIFRNPNGHGGTILALYEQGVLDWLVERGVSDVFYFQVDNAAVDIADPVFMGFHDERDAEMSCKAVIKLEPGERLGIFGLLDGKLSVIEYSDFSPEKAALREPTGALVYRLGSPAIHIFDLEFIRRLNEGELRLPYHIAEKNIPYVDDGGQIVTPAEKNGIKFETFVFDALPLARNPLLIEMDRDLELAAIKNAEGDESPATCRAFLRETYAGWLRAAGIEPQAKVEISPLFALDADDLKRKVQGMKLDPTRDIVLK